ncbi:MAG: class I tRNA ligase family protein, partial [Oscillospiraceae bacterium]|nr:class I tRNA ligase family protein [Oscillospiraceae bacterium]
EDIESLKFNTAIAALMALINEIYAKGAINKAELKTFLILLNPFAPHITEEMYEMHGFGEMLAKDKWAKFDENKTHDATVEIAVQLNGRVRAKVVIPAGCDKATALSNAKAAPAIAAEIKGKTLIKEIYVPDRLVNIVVK